MELSKNLTFEINPNHEVITKLNALRKKDTKFASLMAKQLLDNTMIGAGMLNDPKPLVDRIYKIMNYAMDSVAEKESTKEAEPVREIEGESESAESILKQKP